MFALLLTLHSLMRWLVLTGLLATLFRAYRGWVGNRPFTRADDTMAKMTVLVAWIQMALGFTLYGISPMVRYFLRYVGTAVHERVPRFFGMEHITMMLIAIVLLTTGYEKAKKLTSDRLRFRTIAIRFTIALVIIFTSIPWKFSPLISRPYWRWF